MQKRAKNGQTWIFDLNSRGVELPFRAKNLAGTDWETYEKSHFLKKT